MIYNDKDKILNYAKLEKQVVLFREKENLEKYKIIANSFLYDLNKKKAYIDDIFSIDYSDKNKDEYTISCDKIIWDLEKDIVELYGNPIIYKKKDNSYILKSKLLIFLKKDRLFLFKENPILLQQDSKGKGIYKSDVIKYNMNSKKLDFIDNVNIEYLPVKREESY